MENLALWKISLVPTSFWLVVVFASPQDLHFQKNKLHFLGDSMCPSLPVRSYAVCLASDRLCLFISYIKENIYELWSYTPLIWAHRAYGWLLLIRPRYYYYYYYYYLRFRRRLRREVIHTQYVSVYVCVWFWHYLCIINHQATNNTTAWNIFYPVKTLERGNVEL